MPTFMAIHTWKPEDTITVTNYAIEVVRKLDTLPEDFALPMSWVAEGQRYFCFWKAPSKEALEKFFEEYEPKLVTEVVPVVQSIPPTMEFEMSLMQQIVDMASN